MDALYLLSYDGREASEQHFSLAEMIMQVEIYENLLWNSLQKEIKFARITR